METLNTEVIPPFLEMRVEKALQQGSALVERLNRDAAGWTAARTPPSSNGVPSVIRADHNTYIDRELLVSPHDPKQKLRAPQPPTRDEEVAHSPTLTQSFERLAQERRRSRVAVQRPVLTSVAWVAAILAIVGVLTAMLMMGIAISV